MAFSDIFSGAATGGGLGSFFGPIGTAVGGLGGALSGIFSGSKSGLTSTPDKLKPYNLLNGQQQKQLGQYFKNPIENTGLYGQGSDYLQRLLSGDESAYNDFEAPYIQNFQENILPEIAGRFNGIGTGSGAYNSSALANSLSQAGRSLQTDLAGLRARTQQSALPQALNYAQQPYANRLAGVGIQQQGVYGQQGSQGLFGSAASGLFSNPAMLSQFAQSLKGLFS